MGEKEGEKEGGIGRERRERTVSISAGKINISKREKDTKREKWSKEIPKARQCIEA